MSDDRPKRSTRDARRGDQPVAAAAEARHRETETPISPPMPESSATPERPPAPEPSPVTEPATGLLEPPPLETAAMPGAGDAAASERATPASAATEAEPPPPAAAETTASDPWAVFAEAQAAFAWGFEEIAGEMTGLTRSGLAATSDAAVALLGARTFAEIVEINAGLARRGVDAMIDGSARLSEIGVKALSQATRPLLSRFGSAWSETGLR